MGCRNNCKLCSHLVISTAVTFTGGNLVITIPAGSYRNCEKVCIVVAQSIPATTTLNALVYIQIGTGTELYPFNNACCAQLTACAIQTRHKYSTVVSTTATSGAFKLCQNICNCCTNTLRAITGTAPTTEAATTEIETIENEIARVRGGKTNA